MGFDLRRGDDVLSLGVHTWTRAYAFAIEGGWEPKGTLPPMRFSKKERAAWQGWYDSNEGQFIAADDASNMAAALEKIVATLPPPIAADPAPFDASSLAGGRVDPRTYFEMENKRKILELLIKFLRGGACEIW
jgi:hypothetical protein